MGSLCVLKVGGSLLDLPELGERLMRCVERVRAARGTPVLLVGGGAIVEAVRAFDQTHGLAPGTAHDLALRGMDVTAELLATIIQARLVEELADAPAPALVDELLIIAARRWLERDEGCYGDPLPRSWDVSSDSIAARVARRLGASLLLLKSRNIPAGCGLEEAARRGLVDAWLPREAARLSQVAYINLRDCAQSEPVVLSSRTIPCEHNASSENAASRDSR